jgi:hypothetical protein
MTEGGYKGCVPKSWGPDPFPVLAPTLDTLLEGISNLLNRDGLLAAASVRPVDRASSQSTCACADDCAGSPVTPPSDNGPAK